MDFSSFSVPGTYEVKVGGLSSYPFRIDHDLLEATTLSNVLYYFKGQRCSGLMDQADRVLRDPLDSTKTLDLHGGWYDATGDYGKHLSHLTFSNFFNPQQVSFTDWTLCGTSCSWRLRPGTDYRQYERRLLDEGLYGADYLVRTRVPGGSFFRSVNAPGPGKLPADRVLGAEEHSYRIKVSKDQTLTGSVVSDLLSYESSFRSGGGLAIAALALASTGPSDGEFSRSAYLKAASEAFDFLSANNVRLLPDGKENILDDYCALMAATELYKATRSSRYLNAAFVRVSHLLARLSSWGSYSDYWRADDGDRPFFHAADAGMPVVSLLNFFPLASDSLQVLIRSVVQRSLRFDLSISREVVNPFGYSRQLVQDTLGHRHSAYFFPHGTEASPWWQGEDARLASMATAARMAEFVFGGSFADSLERFASDQLNWILGENPFDACMLQGTGHNNPAYGFFGTFEYTNAPGGIVNGITSGLEDEEDIDFNIPYSVTHKDYDWRWAEQWLPHTNWYMLAVALGHPQPDPEHVNDHPTLSIGAPAPDFHLLGTDGRFYSLASFRSARVLMIVFMCNHCPTSQAYEGRIIRLASLTGVRVVGINPNAPGALRLDELGYSDLDDSYASMKIRARQAGYNFPYLYDGEHESAARAYGPVTTPHVFIFDSLRRLCYEGRIDDTEDPSKTPHSRDAAAAIDALLAGRPVPVASTKTFGCSIKWKEKSVWKARAIVKWASEPVALDTLGLSGVSSLVHHTSGQLRLINFWATWCVPCVHEFPDLVTLNRVYRDRGFQLVSISLDDAAHAGSALAFLRRMECSSPNYIYTGSDKYALIEAIDPSWKGALPYSILVDPGGKVVYAHEGAIDYEAMRQRIFNDPSMGRIFPVAPSRASAAPRFRVLALYENGGHHVAFSARARVWLDQLAADSNFRVDYITNTDSIYETFLARYQVFLQLDYAPYAWKPAAVAAFQRYISLGTGGWIGLHHASLLGEFDGYPMWSWFSTFMGGIRWKDYIARFASATVHVEDHGHPVMKGIPDSFVVRKEEWYTWDKSPRLGGAQVLADVDEASYRPDTSIKMGDHPVIWCNPSVRARNVYIFMGHDPILFDDTVYTHILRNAIFWTAGSR